MTAENTSARRTLSGSITTIASALSLLLAFNQNAQAYDEPNLNLGFTSFLDGGLPAGPGFYAVEYLQFYTANKLADQNGNSLGLPKTNVDALVSLTQFIYVSNLKVGSGSLGLDVIVPWVASANVDDGLGNTVLKGRTGIGDLLIGPLIQFDPIMGANGPLFVQRIEFQVLAYHGALRRYGGRAAGRELLVIRSLLCRHCFHNTRVDGVRAYSLSLERQERRPE